MFKIGDEVEVKIKFPSTEGISTIISEQKLKTKYGHDVRNRRTGHETFVWLSNLKPLSPKPFTKDDLQDGDIVTLKNNMTGIIYKNKIHLDAISRETLPLLLEDFENDLTSKICYNITLVTRNGEIVYKREEEKIEINATYNMKIMSPKNLNELLEYLKKDLTNHDLKNKIINITIKELS